MATWHHDIETYMDKVKTHLFHVLITIQPRSWNLLSVHHGN